MADFSIKKGDGLPALTATLIDANGNAVDITGCTVEFRMVDKARTIKVEDAAVVVNAVAGVVRYDWQTGDTDTAGAYRGEFRVTDGSAKVQTYPTTGYVAIDVLNDVDA